MRNCTDVGGAQAVDGEETARLRECEGQSLVRVVQRADGFGVQAVVIAQVGVDDGGAQES